MLTIRTEAPRRRWPVAFAILTLFEGGCAAMGTRDRPNQGSESQAPSDRGSGSGTTIGTDPATVEPGRTIAPPSPGIDMSRTSIGRGSDEEGFHRA